MFPSPMSLTYNKILAAANYLHSEKTDHKAENPPNAKPETVCLASLKVHGSHASGQVI